MMVQPRTLYIGLFVVIALVIGGLVYLVVRATGSKGASGNFDALPAVVGEAQLTQTSLHELAMVANTVRAAYDQKIAADSTEDEEPKLVCGPMFEEVDITLVTQALNMDIDQKIEEILREKRWQSEIWENCAATCTCATLSNLLEKVVESGDNVDSKLLENAQTSAESLTMLDSVRCVEAHSNLCQSPLLKKYIDQASTIE